MLKIPFDDLLLRDKLYSGHLVTSETSTSKYFVVFISDHVSGSLLYIDKWEFLQVGKQLPDLTNKELFAVAKFFESVVARFIIFI